MTGVGGVSPHHEQVVAFMTRQLLDTISPVNFIATNPEVLAATLHEGGQNLLRGTMNFLADWERAIGGKPPIGADEFQPGEQVAVTKGEVIYRNRLIELIQYAPTTSEVRAEPVLIVPAWIMKYYILDLSLGNSLVKHLVDAGHTVFMISWHNPTAADRELGLTDYLRLGILDALKAIEAIVPGSKVNAVGYCLGGTLLSIAAAYLVREGNSNLNSITLLAAQTDFTEAGELTLFIDDSQLNYLEDIMWDQGYLDTRQMAGAFQLLRSNDLIWSRVVHEYLMDRRTPMIDLMAWNADTTRMPYRMHSEYLHRLFLSNDLFEGRYEVEGRPIALSDIRAPIFVVSMERDHVAPWRSSLRMALPFCTPNFAEAWQAPMKVLLAEQAELLDESRKMAAAWMKRRQEAMETGMQAFGAIAACRDPGTMAAICSEWFKGSMERLTTDMNDARDEGVRLAEIGQRSVMVLFRQGADGAVTDKPNASARSPEPERVKRSLRHESASETRERSAAE